MTDRLTNRRTLLLRAGAALVTGCLASSARAVTGAFTSRRVAVTVRGTGRDVVLIAGLASGPAIWNGLMAAVPGYRWHLVHVRGFAGLPPDANADGPLIQPLADEIARYVAGAGLARPAVIGHSMGGTLAMMLGLKGAAGRVMVVDMLPEGAAMVGGTAQGLGYLADQLSRYFTGTQAGRAYLAQILAQTPGAKGSDADVVANALRDLANIDLGPQLARMNVPLSVVYAVGADPAQAAGTSRTFRAAYAAKPGVRLLPVGPSGHMVMADQPARFASMVRDFLRA
ncbi:alpha/beta fold hydrolase [Sphingobium mellinum]|uniref:alpha/beta fold hydrolase n=1 Tax=Sphingobium mellinum TaxID=1387166 RepID=UPI0030EDA93A